MAELHEKRRLANDAKAIVRYNLLGGADIGRAVAVKFKERKHGAIEMALFARVASHTFLIRSPVSVQMPQEELYAVCKVAVQALVDSFNRVFGVDGDCPGV